MEQQNRSRLFFKARKTLFFSSNAFSPLFFRSPHLSSPGTADFLLLSLALVAIFYSSGSLMASIGFRLHVNAPFRFFFFFSSSLLLLENESAFGSFLFEFVASSFSFHPFVFLVRSAWCDFRILVRFCRIMLKVLPLFFAVLLLVFFFGFDKTLRFQMNACFFSSGFGIRRR